MTTARILMTGSREWVDQAASRAALQGSLTLLGAAAEISTLIHGGARGADRLLADTAWQLGMGTEEHRAQWQTHTQGCPAWDRGRTTCALAGSRRNTKMVQAGADVCLAFPTHGYALPPGADRKRTSRGTWNCAEQARAAGIPTLIVWGKDLFPFGEPARTLLRGHARRTGLVPGGEGQLPIPL